MNVEWVHPGLLLIIGAWLVPLLKGRARQVAMIALPAAALVDCILMQPGTHGVVPFLGQELVFGRVDRLSLLFSYVFSIIALLGMIYSLHVDDDAQHVAALTYAGAALGVTFAGDFLTLFLFWELMALSAALIVWLRRERAAVAAGFRYLLVHVFGGLCLLGGIVLYWSHTGTLAFGDLSRDAGSAAFALILIAFLLNAAVPPLGAWLPDAYPEATATGAVFLTAFTTKSAVYALIRGFAGTEILVWLGAAMAVYGVVYAVLENDARRLLAYHIISQVGYMVCGVGIGTELALNGASAHAFAHILYKALLFMGAGAVLQVTGLRKLSDMGGLYKTMPVTFALYMVGAFAISAVPLFSGFVSKSMVVSSAGESHRATIFLLLTLASAGTFLHTGLKLPYYMFFGKDRGLPAREPPSNMLVAMGLAAAACVLIGVFPALLYGYLPFPVDYAPYTARHVMATLGLLGFTALGFFALLAHLDPEPTVSLDTDWFYRKGAVVILNWSRGGLARAEDFVAQISDVVMRRLVLGAAANLRELDARVIDATAVGVGRVTQATSRGLSSAVSGHAQHYGLIMTAGVLAAIAIAIFAW
ncbi:MAG: Na(+)/H(+) antiporter subunit D [Acidobacteria bacterium 13_1_40CM_65_14]|nr:MAG: Na(+)/H(+) antiporter subunit D [Acidobacteria bacterium 13_1_40CM_65_14]